MNDKLFAKEKKKIFIYMVIVFSIISLLVFFIIMYTNVFVFEYKREDITFKYHSNFDIKKSKNDISLISNDNLARIDIYTERKDFIYSNSEYEAISNEVYNKYIDSKFSALESSCIDHMCTSLYESDKKNVKIVVEFRDSILIVYKYEISKKNFDKYSESFDLVVNSFTVDVE